MCVYRHLAGILKKIMYKDILYILAYLCQHLRSACSRDSLKWFRSSKSQIHHSTFHINSLWFASLSEHFIFQKQFLLTEMGDKLFFAIAASRHVIKIMKHDKLAFFLPAFDLKKNKNKTKLCYYRFIWYCNETEYIHFASWKLKLNRIT